MKFNVSHNKSNTKCRFVEIHILWEMWLFRVIIELTSIQYFACGLAIPQSTAAKSSTYMNHGSDESRTQKHFILEANVAALVIQSCLAKTVSFASRNQGFPSSGLIITIGKISIDKDLNKHKIHKLF